MKKIVTFLLLAFSSSLVFSQKNIPHQFKEIKRGATLEAVRLGGIIKLYILVDDIEQYTQIQVERGNEFNEYSGVKVIEITKGKYKNNYIETEDRFPVSSQMDSKYRLKGINEEGTIKIFAPVTVVLPSKADSVAKKTVVEKKDSVVATKAIFKTDTVFTKVKESILKTPEQAVKTKTAQDSTITKPTIKTPTINTSQKQFDTDTLNEVYGLSDNMPHQIFIFFKDPSVFQWNVTVTNKLDSFNKKQFADAQLLTRGVLTDNGPFIYIKQFKDKENAMLYLKSLKSKPEIFSELKPDQYYLAAISTINYSLLVSTKKINNYMRFYRMNY
jgi:hypothetical protein